MDANHLNLLIGRVALRDAAALREVYEVTSGALMAIAQRMLGERSSAEDVLQETFVALWNKASQLPELSAHPMAFLTTMVRHRCIDLLRKRRPEEPLEWQDSEGQTHQHDVPDENSRPDQLLTDAQDDQRLQLCLQRIEEEPRQAVVLAYYEGLTHAELAERLKRPLGTIKAWVRRSLQRLKDCLGELA